MDFGSGIKFHRVANKNNNNILVSTPVACFWELVKKRRTSHSLELDDLVVELQRLVRPTLELHDVRHLRVNDGELRLDVLLRHVLEKRDKASMTEQVETSSVDVDYRGDI